MSVDAIEFWDFYTGVIELETPLHIGSSEISLNTDSPLLRDSGGSIYIPGSSIAGPLRAHAEKLFPEDYPKKLIQQIFGYSKDDNATQPSRLHVGDAYPEKSDSQTVTTIKDGVAIDRKYGTAKDGAKYDLEITPKDLRFNFTARLQIRENDSDGETIRKMTYTLFKDFENGAIRLGADKTRGLGSCKFIFKRRVLDFKKPEIFTQYLLDRDTEKIPEEKSSALSLSTPLKTFSAALRMKISDQPFMIRSGIEDDEFDGVFTTIAGADGESTDHVPASSIKGVLRSHAERILRRLRMNVCSLGDCESYVEAEIKAHREKMREENKTSDFQKEISIIKEKSCRVCRLFGNAYMAGRLLFKDTSFESGADKEIQTNVAIDQFTGGAAEGKLFSAYPVVKGEFQFEISLFNPEPEEKALLLFILRDLHIGFPPIRFGYGATRGYGHLKAKKILVTEDNKAILIENYIANPPDCIAKLVERIPK